jgi:hypothetical protein
MTAVFFIVCVIAFWMALGAFALVLSARMLRAPTEAELELAAAQAEKPHNSNTVSGH